MNHFEFEYRQREKHRLRKKFAAEDAASESISDRYSHELETYGRWGVFLRIFKGWMIIAAVLTPLAIVGSLITGDPINKAMAAGFMVVGTCLIIAPFHAAVRALDQ